MKKKTPRRRGCSRGKHRSSADFRLIDYLSLVSMKYRIDLQTLFECLVKAWKQQKSRCESLVIECRKKTRDGAVFLITNSSTVVAQFPIPKHILEETSPLKRFAPTRALERTRIRGIKIENPRIEDLKSGMKGIDLKAKILEIPRPRSVITRFGNFATVTNARIADGSGIIRLPLWNKQIDSVSVGDNIKVENARVATFRGERQLRLGRGGQLSVVKQR